MVTETEVVIDRPKGTAHPRYPDFIYPLDYGYLKETVSTDQGEIDIWRGSLPEPSPNGIMCTVDLLKKDSEIKILLGCTDEEKETIFRVHNEVGMRGILINRK